MCMFTATCRGLAKLLSVDYYRLLNVECYWLLLSVDSNRLLSTKLWMHRLAKGGIHIDNEFWFYNLHDLTYGANCQHQYLYPYGLYAGTYFLPVTNFVVYTCMLPHIYTLAIYIRSLATSSPAYYPSSDLTIRPK